MKTTFLKSKTVIVAGKRKLWTISPKRLILAGLV